MKTVATIALFAFIQQSGCDNSPAKTSAPKAVGLKPPLHRFVLTRYPADAGVAFDTQTGQICRTWEWSPSGPAPEPDPTTGNAPQRSIGEFAPLCLSIYTQYPSGPGDGGSAVEDTQRNLNKVSHTQIPDYLRLRPFGYRYIC
jgi:hypothetical protein